MLIQEENLLLDKNMIMENSSKAYLQPQSGNYVRFQLQLLK